MEKGQGEKILAPKDMANSYLTDSLTGILKSDADLDEARTERLKEKYETAD